MSRLELLLLASLLTLSALAQESPTTRDVAPRVAPTATVDQPPSSQALTLEEVVTEALAKNPGVQSALHTINAQQHKIPQAKSLSDPMVSVGWNGNPAPFSVQEGDPSSYRGISVSQQLPYPGKLKLRGQIAAKDVDAAQWDYEAVRRRPVADVKTAYYEYFFYDKALQITRKDKDLLQKLSSISEARYKVGKGMQQDVLRSQVEITMLLQRVTVMASCKERHRDRDEEQ